MPSDSAGGPSAGHESGPRRATGCRRRHADAHRPSRPRPTVPTAAKLVLRVRFPAPAPAPAPPVNAVAHMPGLPLRLFALLLCDVAIHARLLPVGGCGGAMAAC